MKPAILAHLLTQPWAAEPDWLRNFLADHAQAQQPEARSPGERVAAVTTSTPPSGPGVLVIGMRGPVMSGLPDWYSDYIQYVDPFALAATIRAAAANPDVTAIVLDVNSPGGSVTGVTVAAAAVREAAAIKPTYAVANDAMCSAAYWIVSGATAIYSSRTAIVGSIGVIVAYADTSQLYKDMGVQFHIYRSGEEKAPGQTGEGMTPALDSALRHMVDATAEVFYADVAAGRNMTPEAVAEAFGSGRTWVGVYAVESGIADQLGDVPAALAQAQQAAPAPTRRGASTGDHMTPEQLAALGLTADATPAQIQAALDKQAADAQAATQHAGRVVAALALPEGADAPADPFAALSSQAADGRLYRNAQLQRLADLTLITEGNGASGQAAAEEIRNVYAAQPMPTLEAAIARLEAKRDSLPAGQRSRNADASTETRKPVMNPAAARAAAGMPAARRGR